ncbi:hypothetical protein IOD16_14120 [Saccharothrix sp. 6-C]|uniref:hypothetical protein n=1 Tax=Saccharothrix sp. 6-C TaxID=2781735 RepID=UPI001917A137|nr:hypothetical protein [Saccharothrix sp. 6-C]QQQ79434.1 hypothetical protein IOD16_14120 [Saccharothrix sp. 6-C]
MVSGAGPELQPTVEQQARAAVLVGDASTIIRTHVPDLPDHHVRDGGRALAPPRGAFPTWTA